MSSQKQKKKIKSTKTKFIKNKIHLEKSTQTRSNRKISLKETQSFSLSPTHKKNKVFTYKAKN